jgi:glycosyltransferase involved in cell wall biosynthesis
MNDHRARLLFQPSFFLPESWNGMDEHLLMLTRNLDRRRFEPMILQHPTDGPQTALLAERAGMPVIPAPYPTGATARERIGALRRLYAAERIDLLHLHTPVAGGLTVAALAARLARVRGTLATFHQIQPWRLPLRARALNRAVHALMIDCTMAVSGDVRRTLSERTGLSAGRVQIVHNGIEPAYEVPAAAPLPARAPGEVRLGYFGRLSPEKGVDRLLTALALLAAERPAAVAWIVGDGPEMPALQAAAARLGLTNRVQFLGFRADARALMEQVDIVVHTPVYEGFGIVVLEAMAAGRPVVVNDAPGGLPEIVVDGQTGVVVPSGDARALASALARLVVDEDERARLGRNGKSRCLEGFTARRMSDRVAAMYEAVLAGRGGGPSALRSTPSVT